MVGRTIAREAAPPGLSSPVADGSFRRSPAPLRAWSSYLTCYTAALGDWLSDHVQQWWRPLLDGGPYLRVCPIGDRWQLNHAPVPLAVRLDLELQHDDDAARFVDAVGSALTHAPAVVVAGDVFSLPWQHGHQRWHAPHWFTVRAIGDRWRITDSLAMTTSRGPQMPGCFDITDADLIACAQSLPAGNEVFALRERSVIGNPATALGATYRWFVQAPPTDAVRCDAGTDLPVGNAEHPPAGALEGPTACAALADLFAARSDDPATWELADDLWQVVRQRELFVAACEADAELSDPVGRAHWTAAASGWRTLPPLLLHARLRAESGASGAGDGVAGLLRRLAGCEGRHLVTTPAPESSFPAPGAVDLCRCE